nr:hypothetical protein [Candidatus Syntrophosphaera sp.]
YWGTNTRTIAATDGGLIDLSGVTLLRGGSGTGGGMDSVRVMAQTGGTVDADIDLPEAWDIEKGHPDVIVDVQDGGFQIDHPDLDLNKWVNPGEIAGNGIDDDANGYVDDVNGYNFVNGNATIVGHFTEPTWLARSRLKTTIQSVFPGSPVETVPPAA